MEHSELLKELLDYYDRLFLGKKEEEEEEDEDQLVQDPDHYKGKTMRAIEVVEDFDLNFNLGSAITYILRCNKKGCKQRDLKKAIWYLKREISEK